MTKNWKKVNEDAYEALSECSTYFPLLNHGCGSDTCYLEADKFYTESIEGGTILDGGALDANSNFPPGLQFRAVEDRLVFGHVSCVPHLMLRFSVVCPRGACAIRNIIPH